MKSTGYQQSALADMDDLSRVRRDFTYRQIAATMAASRNTPYN
jgi:hypothetical protein